MFADLTVFRMAHAMAVHAGKRQALIAENVANADTPGYAARDLPSFAQLVRQERAGQMLRTTRPGHFSDLPQRQVALRDHATRDADPNGNAISVETEMLKAVEAARHHDRAIAIYRSGLTILRSTLSR